MCAPCPTTPSAIFAFICAMTISSCSSVGRWCAIRPRFTNLIVMCGEGKKSIHTTHKFSNSDLIWLLVCRLMC